MGLPSIDFTITPLTSEFLDKIMSRSFFDSKVYGPTGRAQQEPERYC
jgi:hypothetical protein